MKILILHAKLSVYLELNILSVNNQLFMPISFWIVNELCHKENLIMLHLFLGYCYTKQKTTIQKTNMSKYSLLPWWQMSDNIETKPTYSEYYVIECDCDLPMGYPHF